MRHRWCSKALAEAGAGAAEAAAAAAAQAQAQAPAPAAARAAAEALRNICLCTPLCCTPPVATRSAGREKTIKPRIRKEREKKKEPGWKK